MRNHGKQRTLPAVARWLLRGFVLVAAIGCFPGIAAAGEPLEVLGQSELSVAALPNSNTSDAYVTLLNATLKPIAIGASFEASTDAAVSVLNIVPRTVPAGNAVRAKITFEGLQALSKKVEGVLLVTGGPLPVSRSTTITPAIQAAAPWAELIVIGSFAAMAALAVGIVGKANRSHELRKLLLRAPGPKWSFESWATTGTAVGAVLGTVLGTETLPVVPRQLDKDTFVRLNLLFGALVLVGPFLFQTIRRKGSSPASEEGLWGYNWSLLLACSVTCGAVLGEIATLALLGWEVIGGHTWGWILAGVLFAVWLLAARYFAITAWELATTDWGRTAALAPTRSGSLGADRLHLLRLAEDLRVPEPVIVVASGPRHWKLP